MKALVRVAPKFRPHSGDLVGLRIQAAVPNLAARRMVKTSKGFAATEEQVPAFRKPYLIQETGDCMWISDSDLERFKKKLAWEGFTEFQMLTDLNGRKLEDESRDDPEKLAALQAQVNRLIQQTQGA